MDSFLGEIRLVAYGRIPRSFLPCDGRMMTIAQNQALFALLGTRFGGDGRINFALPDLRGRAVVGATSFGPGTQYAVGTAVGVESVTLTVAQMPPHTHRVAASEATADSALPTDALFARRAQFKTNPPVMIYTATTSDLTPLHTDTIVVAGKAAAHNNMQPYAVVNYCICINGYYPSRDD